MLFVFLCYYFCICYDLLHQHRRQTGSHFLFFNMRFYVIEVSLFIKITRIQNFFKGNLLHYLRTPVFPFSKQVQHASRSFSESKIGESDQSTRYLSSQGLAIVGPEHLNHYCEVVFLLVQLCGQISSVLMSRFHQCL